MKKDSKIACLDFDKTRRLHPFVRATLYLDNRSAGGLRKPAIGPPPISNPFRPKL
jgi:hypothetical protein